MIRPKIKLPLSLFHIFLETTGAILIILLISYPLYHFSSLPEIIPIHFDASGKADGFTSKIGIWFIPILGLVVYIGLFILNKYPHTFNYQVDITEENANYQYSLATQFIRIINLFLAGLFFYITYHIIASALNGSEGLGTWFLPIVLVGTIAPIVWYLIKSSKNG